MGERRTYGQACAVAHALDFVGDRWALLVIRDLRLGPKRFTDLADGLPGIGPTVLSQRLRELVRSGVLKRRALPRPAAATVYELTTWGRELEDVFRALARWGMQAPTPPQGTLAVDPTVLGMRTFFRPSAQAWTATLEIRIEHDCFVAEIVDGQLVELARGEAAAPAATISGRLPAIAALTTSERTLHDAVADGSITVTGDLATATRFVDSARRPTSDVVG